MPRVCTSRVETLMWNIPNPCSWQFITSSIGHDQMRRFMLVHAEILLEIPSHLHHETACACWYFTPVITYQGWVVWHISASFSAIVYQVELHYPATQPFLSEYLSWCLQVKYSSGEITRGLLTYSVHGMNHEASRSLAWCSAPDRGQNGSVVCTSH